MAICDKLYKCTRWRVFLVCVPGHSFQSWVSSTSPRRLSRPTGTQIRVKTFNALNRASVPAIPAPALRFNWRCESQTKSKAGCQSCRRKYEPQTNRLCFSRTFVQLARMLAVLYQANHKHSDIENKIKIESVESRTIFPSIPLAPDPSAPKGER